MAILLPGFIADRSGNFGIMTALLMVPLLGTAGMAVDFAHALSLRTQLYTAADAAAVGSIAEKSGAVAAAMTMSGNGTISLGKTDARNIFMSQMSGELADVKVDLGIDVTKAANRLSSQVSFTATVPTTFMRVLGRDSITISGTATAEYQTASFMDFYILLDNTPSMGVGATATDVATMEKNTSDSCAFACHETENKNNYYNLAKKLGVSMRIDVVRQATKELTLTAKSTRVSNNQFRMGVYTFGTKAEDARLTTISDPTDDLDQVRSYTDAVDLMTIPKQGYNNDQQTSFDNALTQMKTIITTPGDGSTSATPQKILFFVSDGVGDSEKPKGCTKKLTGNRCQEPIDTSFCQPLKDKGIRIAVLYTTYLPLPKNSWYNTWISPFQSQIPTKMQECASPGLYFEVTPTQGITDAMKALFLKVIRAPRITS
ncbi:TadE/TadG family type IV pilus assembly protein [Rhizobium binxianense]|uniref:TadE/TadG family type IV pilus assembly protein n=1 Tax=Rhizobium binxianense TaxID=3024242 RepID=UPI00235F9E50|nr:MULTISPECIES: TadE/TadG family type IV pilus assembly protein [unclassified Rhizobium]MDC9808969.1 pilus assembly protein TadG-related protein [Rhizobium sp. MC62]MDC9833449.1 pilus assembly protein TadG-related protein [Rhizobium sp. MJ37]WEA62217.1 pilus assembly protein TadG-related protein [Rhizobium sp. BJ04]